MHGSCKHTCQTSVTPGDYTVAYGLGYYYGRALPVDAECNMPAEDLCHRETPGFEAGLNAGRRDFEKIDLVAEALAAKFID